MGEVEQKEDIAHDPTDKRNSIEGSDPAKSQRNSMQAFSALTSGGLDIPLGDNFQQAHPVSKGYHSAKA
jgi:hypothetical protein